MTPPLKCECEKPEPRVVVYLPGDFCKNCKLPIHPTAEPKAGEGFCNVCGLQTQPEMLCKCPERQSDGSWKEIVPVVEGEWEKDAVHHLHVFAGLFRDKIEERYDIAQKEYLAFISKLLHDEREKSYEQGILEESIGCERHCEQARAEERERIVKICEGFRKVRGDMSGGRLEYNAALSDIINALK